MSPTAPRPVRMAAAALTAVALAVAAAAVLAVAVAVGGVASERLGWSFATGTLLARAAPALALAALVVGAAACVLRLATGSRAIVWPLSAAGLGAVIVLALIAWRADQGRAALAFPPVHDVATDWRDPLMPTPALLARRGPGAWPIEAAPALSEGPRGGFLGRPVAEVNAATCPDAKPLVLASPPAAAYARLKAAARQAGVRVVTDAPEAGVLEGVAPAPIAYGGHADLLARVRRQGQGARVDLRSVSRHAALDGGSNCRRVAALRAVIAAR